MVSVNQLTAMGRSVRDAVRRLGIENFERFWIPGRLLVSLQIRLFVETVLFSMGKPWSELVSGFKPLRMNMKSIPVRGEL